MNFQLYFFFVFLYLNFVFVVAWYSEHSGAAAQWELLILSVIKLSYKASIYNCKSFEVFFVHLNLFC